MPSYVAKEDLYLTADRMKIVKADKDGSVPDEANFLLSRAGAAIDDVTVTRYGLDAEEALDRTTLLGETGYSSTVEEEQDALKAAESRGAFTEAAHRRQIIANMEAGEEARASQKGAAGPTLASPDASDSKSSKAAAPAAKSAPAASKSAEK